MSIEFLPDAEDWLLSDGQLAQDSEGRPEAFAEIHRRFYARLVRLCEQRLPGSGLAEDIAQTTLLRAWRSLSRFESHRPLWPWLRVIALRQCTTAAQETQQERLMPVTDAMLVSMADHSDDVSERLAVQDALATLSARQRTALTLRYLDDMGTAEAARIIGMNANAFDQMLSRAKARFAATFTSNLGARGLGPLALLGLLRKIARRGADGGSSTATAAGPLIGVSLAMAAGVVAMFSLQLGTQAVTASPRTQRADVVVAHDSSVPGPIAEPQRASGVRASTAPPAQSPMLSTYASPHPLRGGPVAATRFVIATPVGKVSVGGHIFQSAGGPTACALAEQASAAPQCQP